MMAYIKSKFSQDTIFWTVLMSIILFPGLIVGIFRIVKNFSVNIKDFFFLLLFIYLGFFFLYYWLKHIRYMIIKKDYLKYYSFFHPFGKILYFEDFIGKVIIQETGSVGSYKVVYLVDKHNRTAFKLMGLHYSNFDEIDKAIPLKKIHFTPTVEQYFKLLFFERITIKNRKDKDKEERISKLFLILQIISIGGVTLFVIASIIKMVLNI